MNDEMRAAALEAEAAHRDFMNAWLIEDRPYDDPYVMALRYYRSCAEKVHDAMINSQIQEISPPFEEPDVEHIDYPHWPGYLYGCNACEAIMQEQAEWEYDNRENLTDTQVIPTYPRGRS